MGERKRLLKEKWLRPGFRKNASIDKMWRVGRWGQKLKEPERLAKRAAETPSRTECSERLKWGKGLDLEWHLKENVIAIAIYWWQKCTQFNWNESLVVKMEIVSTGTHLMSLSTDLRFVVIVKNDEVAVVFPGHRRAVHTNSTHIPLSLDSLSNHPHLNTNTITWIKSQALLAYSPAVFFHPVPQHISVIALIIMRCLSAL